MIHAVRVLDEKVLLSIQSWRRRHLTKVFLGLTYTGTGRAWILYAVVLNVLHFQGIRFISEQVNFMNSLLAPLIAFGTGSVLKRLVSRKRPSAAIEGYEQVIHPPSCGSFPSSHTSATFSFFVALCLFEHPWAPFVCVWAFLVSFSRMYLGVHFLSDVMAGILLGICSGWAVFSVMV